MPVMRQCADAVQAFDCRRGRRLHITTLRQSYNIPANPTFSLELRVIISENKPRHLAKYLCGLTHYALAIKFFIRLTINFKKLLNPIRTEGTNQQA